MNEPLHSLGAIRSALHPLGAVPMLPCWNLDELDGLLPASEPIDAAVLVGLVPRPRGLQVLLTRRTGGLRHHPGQVSFPGGRIESGDRDPAAAAIRETGEEVGIAPAAIAPLGYLDPIATITGFRVIPLVATLDAGYVAVPDPGEVDEVFEVAFNTLMAPANLQEVVVELRGRSRRVFEYVEPVHPGQRIWGVSASILFNLRQRLEATR